MASDGTISVHDADVLCRILEAATEGNWPNIRDRLVDTGYRPDEMIAAWKAVADIAGVECGICESDF